MMGSLIDTDLHRAETIHSQRVVDAFFRATSRYWKDVYEEDSLDALIYRERQSAVLALVDTLGLPERSHVLEVGCGAGLTAVALAKRGYTVDAIDTVEAMLGLTRQTAIDAGVETLVKTTLSSVFEMSFPSQHFDLAVAVGVVPWLKRPEKALLEMDRVVKSGGFVILTADNNGCLNQMLDPLCFPWLRPLRWKIGDTLERLNLRTASRPRLHRHSIRQIDELLSQAGFHKLEGKTLGFGPFTFFKRKLIPDAIGIRLHQRLQALADRQFPGIRSTGTEYIVMAGKPQTA